MGRCVQCIQKAVLWNIVMLAILSIDTVFVLYFVVRYCIEKGKLKINHIFCVSLGYVYYGLIPFWCFESGIVFHNGGYQSLLMYYSQISRVNLIKYFILSFLMYVMFILGSRTAKRRFVIQKRKASIRFSEQVLFPVVILLGLAILWLNRKFLFKGYNGIKNAYKGTLSAYVIMLFSIALMNFFAQRRTLHFTRRFFNKWGIAFTLFSVMLLSMGGKALCVDQHICDISMLFLLSCEWDFYQKFCENISGINSGSRIDRGSQTRKGGLRKGCAVQYFRGTAILFLFTAHLFGQQ